MSHRSKGRGGAKDGGRPESEHCDPIHSIQSWTSVFLPPDLRLNLELTKSGAIIVDPGTGLRWKCRPNKDYGSPGLLGKTLQKLIFMRWISGGMHDDIDLGSLQDICVEIGLPDGEHESVKEALHQIASTFFVTEERTVSAQGESSWTRMGFTPYSVLFKGKSDRAADQTARLQMHWCYRYILSRLLASRGTASSTAKVE